jgi:hypothetical protein
MVQRVAQRRLRVNACAVSGRGSIIFKNQLINEKNKINK